MKKKHETISTAKLELMECAVSLFRKFGYDNVSIRQICESHSISKTTFYFHYRSKEDIMLGFFNRVNMNIEENFASLFEHDTAVSQLWSLTKMYIQRFVDMGVDFGRVLYRIYLSSVKSPLLPKNIYMRDAMINLLKRAQRNREITNKTETSQIYETLIYTMDGIGYGWLMANGDFDLVKRSKRAFDCLLMTVEQKV
jgi:AcrR family transcriptional regulator